jgi:hypothetical protein
MTPPIFSLSLMREYISGSAKVDLRFVTSFEIGGIYNNASV